ncbi:hypothetical protein L2E82_46000 [Cichorium intybus]|uniref:Uncharacterized protein n=1 Tax=Cichorium intybus TaxID=13427 RepID=A0ACB8ZUF4_CICIN|nr:hypothetical protein L2E82_46000 [Cichorium intybus]
MLANCTSNFVFRLAQRFRKGQSPVLKNINRRRAPSEVSNCGDSRYMSVQCGQTSRVGVLMEVWNSVNLIIRRSMPVAEDPLGIQGRKVKVSGTDACLQVWAGPLSGPVLLLFFGTNAQKPEPLMFHGIHLDFNLPLVFP